MQTSTRSLLCMALAALVALPAVAGQRARRAPKRKAATPAPEEEFAARRLLKRAQDLLLAKDTERGIKMLETVIDQHPKSFARYEAYLELGRHYLGARDYPKGVAALRHLNGLVRENGELTGKALDVHVEGLYLIGTAQYHMRQYSAAFPILRKITTSYPNTVWANQAYYYIGMCHFMQGNWNKAIKALSLVGTFVDPESPTVQYAEAGRRFYVKIEDADLPVLQRLGKTVEVAVATASGDKETLPCIPLAGEQGLFIASIGTQVGAAKPGDGTLQVVGGDSITTSYVDDNTKDGEKDVAREGKVTVVSTGSLRFTLGTYEAKASAAFLGQSLFVLLRDVDLDTTAEGDEAMIKIVSRYKEAEDEATTAEGLSAVIEFREEADRWKTRDEVTLKLSELPPVTEGEEAKEGEDAPKPKAMRSGRFGGSVSIEALREGRVADKTDSMLSCALNDEIVAVYVDELHIGGRSPREVRSSIEVIGEIDGRPRATQNVVPDAVLRSRKNLVEATAFLELARIFKSMGLSKGADEKADEGLERAETVLRLRTPIPSSLREQGFKLKWELNIVKGDYGGAIGTCRLFHRLYPDSPFVDEALMGIGQIRLENKEYREAIGVLREILRLPNSQAKAKAQFLIAEATEASAGDRPEAAEAAIQQYKLCADRYPESEFAGQALAKLVDYHYKTRDYSRAADLLEQIFQDYPDGEFLDGMLLKWVLVAYRKGDYETAYNKCNQLVFEYPSSAHAATARKILPRIESKLKQPADQRPVEKDAVDEADDTPKEGAAKKLAPRKGARRKKKTK